MNSFSNQEGEGFDSIENLHGNIHTGVGGDNGHMTDLAVSGFDPIFFLHHAYAMPNAKPQNHMLTYFL